MALSAPGIGSNLDVSGLIGQLMAIESRPFAILDKKEAAFQAQLSAYGSLKGAMAAFQSTMRELASLTKFLAFKASSSDAAIVAAQAAGSAAAGSYSIEITALAQAQKLVTTGAASTTTAIGAGGLTTLTFDFGTISGGTFDSVTGKYTGAAFTGAAAGTVTINGTTNTLAGVRDAINRAEIGVTATIVNDGGASPYRLVLSADDTGKGNSIRIAVNGDAAISALLAHDSAATQNLAETVTAQNAALKVDGIAISKASNSVTDVISGVTLSLLKTNAGSPLKVNVAQDSAQISAAVNAFVKAYNDINRMLADLSAYNAATKQGAVLNGDATVRTLHAQIRATLGTALSGPAGGYTLLSQIGVAFQKDGALAVDAAKLQSAIEAKPTSIGALFAATGTPTDSLVSYLSATANTRPGDYAVNVTQLATRGETAGSAPAALTVAAGSNDTLEVRLGGVDATVTLAAGTYASAAELAAEVARRINGATAYAAAGLAVTVTEAGGVMTLTADGYGPGSGVEVTGGNGKTDLLGGTPTTTAGLDAAGSINGIAATGAGQFLTGAAGDASEGLRIQIADGATGERGTVTFSQGYAYRLDALAANFLSAAGAISGRTDGISRTIKDLSQQREALERRLAGIEKRYRAQFTALDAMLSSLARTSSFLQQQLANLPKNDT